ncbi:CpaF family protein [Actinocrinis puniceicyclus]|uniref:CpaF family protein n=1 Tax=Actinocrinis puniceicyclus TaxID=977794 RepID=A0A8J8BFD5_9ACTN|nr:ATPase, T2SS/T4P/T4SS family [Actinocrinis puniceicyclus]MBS2966535.1 CpaF family protein [Actinocrinis puniceicyclus]
MSVNGFTHFITPDGARFEPWDERRLRTLAEQIRAGIAEHLAGHARDAGGPLPAAQKVELTELYLDEGLDAANAAQIAAGGAGLSVRGEQMIRARVRDALLGLGGLQALMDDPGVETINANGCDVVFAIRADGQSTPEAPIADNDEAMVELVRALARSGEEERRFDRGVARLNAMLPDGSRLFAAMGVAKRPCLSIRKNLLQDVSLRDLVERGMLDEKLAAFLTALAGAKFNLLISGGTSDGKTTLLRALLGALPPETRLVTIEDTFELNLDQYPHRHRDVVAYQAREPNTEGQGEVSQAELVRWALRMSPDRVIVGELRNDEFIPMCNAMNQGLDGSMATVHASSSEQVVERLINLGLQSPERLSAEATVRLLGSAVDFIIQLGRQRDKTRVVTSIREVCGSDGASLITNETWRPGDDRRAVRGVQLRPQTLERLVEAGYDPAAWE